MEVPMNLAHRQLISIMICWALVSFQGAFLLSASITGLEFSVRLFLFTPIWRNIFGNFPGFGTTGDKDFPGIFNAHYFSPKFIYFKEITAFVTKLLHWNM
jgi:hypothetical protein